MSRAFRMGQAALILVLALAAAQGRTVAPSAPGPARLDTAGNDLGPIQGVGSPAFSATSQGAGTVSAPLRTGPLNPSDSASGRPVPDSLAAKPKSRADTVIIVKHRFNHREQIITGSVIMTCLALMLVAMNNYNPR